LDDNQPSSAALKDLKQIQGLFERVATIGVKASDPAPVAVAAAEFLLEGLVAHRRLSRSEEHGFKANDSPRTKPERPDIEMEYEDWARSERQRKSRRGGGNGPGGWN
jgi:magnesium chelatase subunit I